MNLNVTVGDSGFKDVKQLVKHVLDKSNAIKAAPEKDVSAVFPINELAKSLHPDYQIMKVIEIIDHKGADAKTFVLKGNKAAYFRAGQYISVLMKIGKSITTRPYSISSSPALSKDGIYTITVRRTPEEFAADYMLNDVKVGDELKISEPLGNFYYEELRDAKNVVALAGGSGITPFYSMAAAIRDGIEDFNLTIIFGSRNEDAILFKKELDEIAAACDKVKVVHVLSDEEKEGFEHGFINVDIIKKYAPANEDYSIFMCGPEAMYRFADGEIKKLGINSKFVRRELLGVTKQVEKKADFPENAKGKTFNVTVRIGDYEKTIPAKSNEPVLTAIERAGIAAPSRCRSGECGWCRSKLLSGEVYVPAENDEDRRYYDKAYNCIHPCASFPVSDLVIEVPGTYIK